MQNLSEATLSWWLEFTLMMLGGAERQRRAEALRRQFYVIEGGKRA